MNSNFTNLSKKIANDLNVATTTLQKFKDETIISIFGSARTPTDHPFYQDTLKISSALAQKGFTICTGGGPGLMQAANQGAKQGGGKTFGLSIVLPHEQASNPFLDEDINFQNFAQRKIVFSTVSDAYIVVPGGYGSLDELFEVLTLMQCNVTKKVPIVLFNSSYWKPLLDFIHSSLLTHKMIDPDDVNMMFLADSPDDVIRYISDNVPID